VISYKTETGHFTGHEGIAKTVRNHFNLGNTRVVLYDSDEHVVILDHHVPSGSYVLKPVEIKSEPEVKFDAKLDSKNFNPYQCIKLEPYNHNTKLFTFRIPGIGRLPTSSFLQCNAFIEKENKEYARAYTPISCLVENEVRLLIKIYPEGRVTQAFDKIKVGDTFQIRGPVLKLPYKANMKEEIAMLAGGSGITPMLQVIDAIVNNPEDKTKVTLLFANQTEEDILLRETLEGITAKHKNITVRYSVDKPRPGWTGFSGFVTQDVLKEVLPEQKRGEKILIYVCGPPPFYKCISGDKDFTKSPPGQGEVTGLLKDLGYTSEQVYKF